MLYREIIAVFSEIHTKHKIHCVGRKFIILILSQLVNEVTTALKSEHYSHLIVNNVI
jgi:hypothetical protein